MSCWGSILSTPLFPTAKTPKALAPSQFMPMSQPRQLDQNRASTQMVPSHGRLLSSEAGSKHRKGPSQSCPSLGMALWCTHVPTCVYASGLHLCRHNTHTHTHIHVQGTHTAFFLFPLKGFSWTYRGEKKKFFSFHLQNSKARALNQSPKRITRWGAFFNHLHSQRQRWRKEASR